MERREGRACGREGSTGRGGKMGTEALRNPGERLMEGVGR